MVAIWFDACALVCCLAIVVDAVIKKDVRRYALFLTIGSLSVIMLARDISLYLGW